MRAGIASGAWRATVIRVTGDGRAFVTAKRLNRDRDFGPCTVVQLPGDPLAAGDRVLVMPIDGDRNEVAVIGRI